MKIRSLTRITAGMAGSLLLSCSVCAAENPFVGRYALTIPGGKPGWLGIAESGGNLTGSILWFDGSVVPVQDVRVEGDTLVVIRIHEKREGESASPKLTETITATLAGDELKLTTSKKDDDGGIRDRADFTGKRIPPLPAPPDLSKVKFGPPVELFNGRNLEGWTTLGDGPNGWSARDGVLVNEAPQKPGKQIQYANLRTEKEFADFNLKIDFRVPEKGNSGIYLRGVYEIQVTDWFDKPVNPHGVGALYGRIPPASNPAKAPGEWQSFDITLVDRHITVILNGVKIIDNQPALGCTGGALWSDEFRPGPIYLQGDHTSAEFRNIVLTPVAD